MKIMNRFSELFSVHLKTFDKLNMIFYTVL